MISFERSEKEIKEKKEQIFRQRSPFPTATAKPFFCFAIRISHKFQRTKGKIKFCSHTCSCFTTADCQIHFTHTTDFFRINQYIRSWRSIWRLNASEDKTYHRGGQNANRGQMCFIIP